MLETIREYARDRLATSGHETETRARHADVYLCLAERAEPALRGPDQARWIEILDAEHDNLRAAMGWAVDSGQVDAGLRTGAALWRFWQVRGHVFEGRSLLGRLLDTGAGSPVARAAAQLTMARCAFWEGDYRAMQRFSQDSMSEHRRLHDDLSLGFALMIFGAATATHGDPQGGRSMVHDALAIARRIGDSWLELCSLGHLGMILIAQRDLTTARDVLEEGLRAAHQVQDERCVGWILISLGREALRSRDAERAGERFAQALTVERRLGDVWGVATALQGLATIALESDDPARACVSLMESLTTAAAVHDRPGIAAALELTARAVAMRGDLRAAVLMYGCASVVEQTVNNPRRAPTEDDHELTAMRATLGETQFDDLWKRGRSMPLEEAVAVALDRSAASIHR